MQEQVPTNSTGSRNNIHRLPRLLSDSDTRSLWCSLAPRLHFSVYGKRGRLVGLDDLCREFIQPQYALRGKHVRQSAPALMKAKV